jgi:hypothetical protein
MHACSSSPPSWCVRLAPSARLALWQARAAYTPTAKRGSILYFVMAGLSTVMSMYETSLDSFLGVFHTALDKAKRDVVLEKRMDNMIASISTQVYEYTCTGIFERHKLMFAFQMTCAVQEGNGELNRTELDFFLKGDTSLDATERKCPVAWLIASGWKDLNCLAKLVPQVGRRAARRRFDRYSVVVQEGNSDAPRDRSRSTSCARTSNTTSRRGRRGTTSRRPRTRRSPTATTTSSRRSSASASCAASGPTAATTRSSST